MRFDCSTPKGGTSLPAALGRLTGQVAEEDQASVLRGWLEMAGHDAPSPGRELLMDSDEIRRIAAHPLVTIGAHTVHHYALKRLGEGSRGARICRSRSMIEAESGEPGSISPIPTAMRRRRASGKRSWRARWAISRRSPRATACCGPNTPIDLHALPRISVNGRHGDIGAMRAMLTGATTPLANRGKRLVTV